MKQFGHLKYATTGAKIIGQNKLCPFVISKYISVLIIKNLQA
jgi:hypothetical protein